MFVVACFVVAVVVVVMSFHYNKVDSYADEQGDLDVAHVSSVIDMDYERSVGNYYCICPLTLG